jgi:hypothetical protein
LDRGQGAQPGRRDRPGRARPGFRRASSPARATSGLVALRDLDDLRDFLSRLMRPRDQGVSTGIAAEVVKFSFDVAPMTRAGGAQPLVTHRQRAVRTRVSNRRIAALLASRGRFAVASSGKSRTT